ncbi:uncharacterized protein LOC142317360 isoform X3 [Lycorma delicatula]|uniref:uncharacterized protein LOC142317360 isoform X3 n=1 Tax=Lycorma delicatula TaxID=130591 RepID=UPI003F50E1CD
MRAKILIFNLMMFNAINALLVLKSNEYTECERDETLSCSCESMDNCVIKDIIPTKNLKSAFDLLKISFFTLRSDHTSLRELNNHIYFQYNYFKIHLSEDTLVNRNDFSPALLKLLNKIPQNIMIKEGIIHTKGKSLISGIKVKDLSIKNKPGEYSPYELPKDRTLNVAPRCNRKECQYSFHTPKRSFITLDCSYIYVTSECDSGIKREYFRVSEDYNLQNTVEKNDMTCFLYSNNEKDKYNYQQNTTGEKFSGLHFELYFSYTCRLFVRLPIYSFEPNGEYSIIPLYQSYRFTVGGYDLKSENSHQITGLTYLVTQTPINNEMFPE